MLATLYSYADAPPWSLRHWIRNHFSFFYIGIPLAGAAPAIADLPSSIDSGAPNAYTTVDGVTFEAEYGRTGSIKTFTDRTQLIDEEEYNENFH
ncbi:MAG: hypothetical protein PVI90_02530 [Desulfobacteraceae bacterium]|jgi:hypothetical protein